MTFSLPSLQEILLSLPPLLLALTFHEFAHALMAYKMGDSTARNLGRLTLNPLKHLDPLGTLLLIFYHFGWAKPVPVNPFNFHHRERGMLLVSLAGPGSNFLLAFLSVVIYQTADIQSDILHFMLWEFVQINILLAAFNLIPLPPLDGSKIVFSLLPRRYAYHFEQLETYGPIILLFLAFTNLLSRIFYPIADFLTKVLIILLGFFF